MDLILENPNRLIPWSAITITPDLRAIIGVGRGMKGLFIYEYPYNRLAFSDRGIIVLE